MLAPLTGTTEETEERRRREREQRALERSTRRLRRMEREAARGKGAPGDALARTRHAVHAQAMAVAGEIMCEAADADAVGVVEEWLARDKAFVNARDAGEQTVLHRACAAGSLRVVMALLAAGADCYLADRRGWTALHCAAFENRVDVLLELCKCKHIDFNATNDDGNTPLHYLVRNQYEDARMDAILAAFLAGGADINAQNLSLETPLHMAVWKGNLGMVTLLLKNGADPSIQNAKQESPWDWAVRMSNPLFLSAFESVMAMTATKPASAATSFALNSISHLPNQSQQQQQNLQQQNQQHQIEEALGTVPAGYGNPATRAKSLWNAIRAGAVETVRELLRADRKLADATFGLNKNTALHIAVAHENAAVVKLLLEAATKVAKNTLGWTPLMSALWQGNEELALLVLMSRHRVDVGAQFADGNTALHFAARMTTRYCTLLLYGLLERGADVDAANSVLDTPLHVAVQCGNVAAVRTLTEGGANVHKPNRLRETPLDLAMKCSQSTIISILESVPTSSCFPPPSSLSSPEDDVPLAGAPVGASASSGLAGGSARHDFGGSVI